MIKQPNIAIIVPTYNNATTVAKVIDDLLLLGYPVIVVNDGSTDSSLDILQGYGQRLVLIDYSPNKGKGYALRQGFIAAQKMGIDNLISIDSDGQHKVSDVNRIVCAIIDTPNAIIVGNRHWNHPNMPQKNMFANRFSNVWFLALTLISLTDTQSGFRAYPIKEISKIHLFTNRYELETEVLVRAAWKGIIILAIPIDVYYAPAEERISHFRPARDFIRISLLNILLCIGAILWGYPSLLYHCIAKTLKAKPSDKS